LEEGEVAEAIRSMSSLGWIGVRTSSALPIDENVLVVA
jgi:hypothetical protein